MTQVDPDAFRVVDLWWSSRGQGGMGGSGPLPVSGGLMDQTVWFTNACRILDDQYGQDQESIRNKPSRNAT